MANHEVLHQYLVANPQPSPFSYRALLTIAVEVLDAETPSGRDYAVMRFLQKYCESENAPLASWVAFKSQADPRRSPHRADARDIWTYSHRVAGPPPPPVDGQEDILRPETTAAQSHLAAFVEFLVAKLRPPFTEQSYSWRYTIRDAVPWLSPHLFSSTSLSDAEEVLRAAAVELRNALQSGDERRAFEAVRLIMDWGGVYYPRGSMPMNQRGVEALLASGSFVAKVRSNAVALICSSPAGVDLQNSGWTKVWAALLPSLCIMYDSRVSKAIATLLAEYCQRARLQRVPPEIDIAQTESSGKRHVEGIRVASTPQERTRSVLLLTNVLRLTSALAEFSGIDVHRYRGLGSRGLEARLFMMGR